MTAAFALQPHLTEDAVCLLTGEARHSQDLHKLLPVQLTRPVCVIDLENITDVLQWGRAGASIQASGGVCTTGQPYAV